MIVMFDIQSIGTRLTHSFVSQDYGILSVVFQLYSDVNLHFKIPPTVFYPQPKVDSALVGLHFLGPTRLRERLCGVNPAHLRRVVTTAFQQRRKTIRNSLKKLAKELFEDDTSEVWTIQPPLPESIREAIESGDEFAATQELPENWPSKRPEELTPGQFVELTRLLFGPNDGIIDPSVPLGNKVWRKLKHGKNT
jgi:16S rRNA A1518/A1519 N6-dimethyltransferase RsmA/KsgA/DIM1 with predicted DNA glycosylase/AP lyase activity